MAVTEDIDTIDFETVDIVNVDEATKFLFRQNLCKQE